MGFRVGISAIWLIQERDGQRLEVGLLRPLAWLNGRDVGERIELDLAEMGAEGEFQVIAIGACPEIEVGPGRVVTGIFRHNVGFAYNLWLEGRDEPIGVTERHPFWSVDREAWVAACELLVGERLLERDGIARVASLTERDPEPVLFPHFSVYWQAVPILQFRTVGQAVPALPIFPQVP